MPFRIITCRDYSKYNHTVLACDIESYDCNPVYTETNVNTAPNYMERGLTSIIDRHAPKITKRVKCRKCPWLTYEIKTLMNTKQKYQDLLFENRNKPTKFWNCIKEMFL